MKKAILKDAISKYMSLVEQSEEMKRDPVHIVIQKTMYALMSQHRDGTKAKYDKDEALEKALDDRSMLIKRALSDDDDDDDDNISLSSSPDDESNNSFDEDDLKTDSRQDEQWLMDIFNESIMEKYNVDEVKEKAQAILKDEDAFDEILPLVRKKYLKLILLQDELQNSELHDKVIDMMYDYDSDNDYDSDDGSEDLNLVELSKSERWNQAIKRRSLAIKKTIRTHWTANEETEDDSNDDDVL